MRLTLTIRAQNESESHGFTPDCFVLRGRFGFAMNLEISGHSTALYSTYWFLEPLGVLFDCGDGASAFLQQRGRKVKYIFCSHPDRDHLAGLLQFVQVNSRSGYPKIVYPESSGSFAALRDFSAKFDPHIAENCEWIGVSAGSEIKIKPNWVVQCYANKHLPHHDSQAQDKSLSYSLINHRRKLKPEFSNLSGPEIGVLAKEKGDDYIRYTVTETALTYSADTPIEAPEFWRDPKLLIHECTFLCKETAASRGQDVRHSVLEDVLKMAAQMPSLEKLVLGHFSCRYHQHEIREQINIMAKQYQLNIPVYAVPPGETQSKILSSKPVFKP